MPASLFTLKRPQVNTVDAASVIKHDVMPWLASSLVIISTYYGIAMLVSGTLPSSQRYALDLSLATLYQQQLLVYILLFCGCALAHKGLTVKTWVTFIFLILCIAPQYYSSITTILFPNSIVSCAVSMIGVMATFRLVEYYNIRFNIKLEDFSVTNTAIAIYVTLVLIVICSQIPY